MIRRYIIPPLFLLFTFAAVFPQQPWSLEDCIQYAMENNIQIQQQVLNTALVILYHLGVPPSRLACFYPD